MCTFLGWGLSLGGSSCWTARLLFLLFFLFIFFLFAFLLLLLLFPQTLLLLFGQLFAFILLSRKHNSLARKFLTTIKTFRKANPNLCTFNVLFFFRSICKRSKTILADSIRNILNFCYQFHIFIAYNSPKQFCIPIFFYVSLHKIFSDLKISNVLLLAFKNYSKLMQHEQHVYLLGANVSSVWKLTIFRLKTKTIQTITTLYSTPPEINENKKKKT